MTVQALPSMEHSFTVSIKGNRTGRIYDGTFTYKIPNLRTESEIEKAKIRLNEGLAVSEEVEFMHEMAAYLNYTLTDSPEWWKSSGSRLELHDINVLTELYQECVKFQRSWREKVWADSEPAKS